MTMHRPPGLTDAGWRGMQAIAQSSVEVIPLPWRCMRCRRPWDLLLGDNEHDCGARVRVTQGHSKTIDIKIMEDAK